ARDAPPDALKVSATVGYATGRVPPAETAVPRLLAARRLLLRLRLSGNLLARRRRPCFLLLCRHVSSDVGVRPPYSLHDRSTPNLPTRCALAKAVALFEHLCRRACRATARSSTAPLS